MFFFFFFNDTATTEIYTLSLHDALPISADGTCRRRSFPPSMSWRRRMPQPRQTPRSGTISRRCCRRMSAGRHRSEEHTSELQSPDHLVCRLLLEKKKNQETTRINEILSP